MLDIAESCIAHKKSHRPQLAPTPLNFLIQWAFFCMFFFLPEKHGKVSGCHAQLSTTKQCLIVYSC